MGIPSLSTIGGLTQPIGYAGQLSASGPRDIDTGINENATPIDLGVFVAAGVATGPGKPKNIKPMASGLVPVGVTLRDASGLVASADGANTIKYAQFDEVPVLKQGRCFVVAAEAAAAREACIALSTAGGTVGSATTGGAANGTTRMATNAIWLDSVGVGDVGEIQILQT